MEKVKVMFDNPIILRKDDVNLDKHPIVLVPMGHVGILVVDGVGVAKLIPGEEWNVKKMLGNKMCSDNKEIKINVFYVPTNTNTMRFYWGFGGVTIYNSENNESYILGANGSATIDIDKPSYLMKEFPGQDTVTLLDVQSKLFGRFAEQGKKLVLELLAGIDKDKIQTYTSDFAKKLHSALKEDKTFKDLGLTLTSVNEVEFISR